MADGTQTRSEPSGQLEAVVRASRVLLGVVARSLVEVEGVLSLLQFRTLVIVATTEPATLGEIATRLRVHPSNATRLVDKLVGAGLVDRREDTVDRRYLAVTLTPEGRGLVDRVMTHRHDAIAQVMARMAADDRRTLALALDAFADAAGEAGTATEEFVLSLPT